MLRRPCPTLVRWLLCYAKILNVQPIVSDVDRLRQTVYLRVCSNIARDRLPLQRESQIHRNDNQAAHLDLSTLLNNEFEITKKMLLFCILTSG